MIFRLTQKLAKKIGIRPSRCLQLEMNPFADWCVHLFTAQRVQYVIMTNTPSLYSMVMYGRGITNDNQFVKRALSYMSEFMTDDGNEFLFRKTHCASDRHDIVLKDGRPKSSGIHK